MNKILIFFILLVFAFVGKSLINNLDTFIQNQFLSGGVILIFVCSLAAFFYFLYKKGYGFTGIQHRGFMGYFKTYLNNLSPYVGPIDATTGERRDMRAMMWFFAAFIVLVIIFILSEQISHLIGTG